MKGLLFLFGLACLLVLTSARATNGRNLSQAHRRLDGQQERNYGPLADPERDCPVTKWHTSILTKKITLTQTRTMYPKASIYTQMVTKTCTTTLRVPTTIWKTQKFSITTTLMKAHTTTVQRPTTIWKTQKFSITTTLTKALTVTVLRPTTVTEAKTHVELEAETVFEACTNESVAITHMATETVTNVGTGIVTQVVTETVHVTATVLPYTTRTAPEVVTLTVTDPPPTINAPTFTVTETVTISGPSSVRVEVATITVSQSELPVCPSGSTADSANTTAFPDTLDSNTSTIISDPPLSPTPSSTTVEVPIFPDSTDSNTSTVISDLPPSLTPSSTTVEISIYPDSIGINTSTVISNLLPSPTSSSATVEISIYPEATPTDSSDTTPSGIMSDLALPPPPCNFPLLALNNTFEDPSDISAWSPDVLPFGTSASYPPSSALVLAHSGSRHLKMRMSGSVTIPGARMTVTRTISNICFGAEYEMSAWVRAPNLDGSTGGRCSVEFWGAEVMDGVAGEFRLVMGGVVVEDGVWRMIQGEWVQSVEAEQVQMRFQVQCGGSGERSVYMDDFVVVRME